MKTVLAPGAPWPYQPLEPPKPKPVPQVKLPRQKRLKGKRRTDHTDAKFNEWLKTIGGKNV